MYESGLEKEGKIDLKARYSNLSSVRASDEKGKLESLDNKKNSPKRRSNSRSKEQTRQSSEKKKSKGSMEAMKEQLSRIKLRRGRSPRARPRV